MPKPWIVPVGGFLGAGKTTLILAAAKLLSARGLRPAAILNDQAGDLVDTALARSAGISADEVTGGCFCCRFSDLISAAERLEQFAPDVIFIEPVGSCTDLAATILRPLLRDFTERYRVAPLTVLVDPGQARRMEQADSKVRFLFEHQLQEADIVAFSKCETHATFPELPRVNAMRLSASEGTGLDAWLNEVLSGEVVPGTKLIEVDYREYAAAEAALGWLNWSGSVSFETPMTAAALLGPLVEELETALRNAGGTIAHLKVLSEAPGSYLKLAVTDNDEGLIVEGDLAASPAQCIRVRINLRAVVDAKLIEHIFWQSLRHSSGTWTTERFQCFSPAAPVPERRIAGI
ncbi:MAG: hypothetical protein JO061_17390 [Acidobacteriaceae bacterium]|nr:hypothetical protein [Acidobacteriaceae bacterium]